MIKNYDLVKHEKFLRENVFYTNSKWSHFNLIFKDIKKFAKETKKNSTILSLERNSLYGGVSLFAPFFYRQTFVSVDCVSSELKKRGAYNRVDAKTNFISMKKNYQFNYKKIKLPNSFADLILVPNLMHHIDDVEALLKQIKRILKKNGKVYIFEPLVRELHQVPEDYFRITPYGFKKLLKKYGFSGFKIEFDGGPFTAVGYCWDQAIQFLPKKQRLQKSNWLKKKFPEFISMDRKYKKNNVRKNTIFPMSFSIQSKLIKK